MAIVISPRELVNYHIDYDGGGAGAITIHHVEYHGLDLLGTSQPTCYSLPLKPRGALQSRSPGDREEAL